MFTVKLNDRFNITCKGEKFIAEVYDCFVRVHPVDSLTTTNNGVIFELLGINKYNFCEKAYGYEPTPGGWPECNPNDYEALSRVLEALAREPDVFIEVRIEEPDLSSLAFCLELTKRDCAAKKEEIANLSKRLELAKKELEIFNNKIEKLTTAYNALKSI